MAGMIRHTTRSRLFRWRKRYRRLARDNVRLRVALGVLLRQNEQLKMDINQRVAVPNNVGTHAHVPIHPKRMSTEHEQGEGFVSAEDAIKRLTKEISLVKTRFECLLRGNPQLSINVNQSRTENGAAARREPPQSKCPVREVVTRHPLAETTQVAIRLTTQDPPPSALWKACDFQRIEEVGHLLSLSHTRDDPGPDGTTAFALSLAQLNTEQTLAILESGIEPKADILFCAKEFVKLQLSRPEEKALQSAMNSSLGGSFEPTSVVPPQCDCKIDERYLATCQKYPFINTKSEFKYAVNSVMKKRLLGLGRYSKYLLFKDIRDPFILDNSCIYSLNGTWKISDDVDFNSDTCNHVKEVRKENCAITYDLFNFAKKLETELCRVSELMRKLKPSFTLVGSVPEHTRIGIANELDITIDFRGWVGEVPFKTTNDAYYLHRSEQCPEWMASYFDAMGKFKYHQFMTDLLEAIDKATEAIFGGGQANKNSGYLTRITTNKNYSCQKCRRRNSGAKKPALFTQCKHCIVAISQTKMGVCVQFQWHSSRGDFPGSKTYCSIDLVPVMRVASVDMRRLQRTVNSETLSKRHPSTWFANLKDYVREDKILEELGEGKAVVDRLLLKTNSCDRERNYILRAGQLLGPHKFQSERLREAYCYVKAIKKVLRVDNVSMFMVKKLLMGPRFLELDRSTESMNELVRLILNSPELRLHKFDIKIDYEKWSEGKEYIPVKNAEYRGGGGMVSRLSTTCCVVSLVCCQSEEKFHRHETAHWFVNCMFPTAIIGTMLLGFAIISLYAFLIRERWS